MILDNLTGNRQAYAAAALFGAAGFIRTVETVKDIGKVPDRDALAVIRHIDLYLVPEDRRAHVDPLFFLVCDIFLVALALWDLIELFL